MPGRDHGALSTAVSGLQALRSVKSTKLDVLSAGLALVLVAAGLQTGVVAGTLGGGSVCQEAFTLVLTESLPSRCRRRWAGPPGGRPQVSKGSPKWCETQGMNSSKADDSGQSWTWGHEIRQSQVGPRGSG